jgi:23S rRNA (uracil1939-C5)-methyltransferase
LSREDGGPGAIDGEIVILDAEKLIGGGRAIAHQGGLTWMVSGALPGERVRARAVRRRAGISEAQSLEVIESAHPARLAEPCPHASVCGGCDWPHVDIDMGAPLKASAAAEAARTFPDLAALIATAPVHRSAEGYRLRARLHWDPEPGRLGFYAPRSRVVAAIPSCRILSACLMQTLPDLIAALAVRCPEPVDLEWLEGSDPTVAVAALRPAKHGPATVDPGWVPSQDAIGPTVSGFHRLTRAGRVQRMWGASEVTFELPIPLTVPVGAFFQGNRHLLVRLFERVAELAGDSPEPVVDLHAGVGFLAAAARCAGARDLTLVEPHRASALAAHRNLPGARVAVGETAESFVSRTSDLTANTLVITDPPRTGMSRTLLSALLDWRPRRILMLGCDPATWARDAGRLCEHGYWPQVVEIFDLFPSTHHVEILAMLERR